MEMPLGVFSACPIPKSASTPCDPLTCLESYCKFTDKSACNRPQSRKERSHRPVVRSKNDVFLVRVNSLVLSNQKNKVSHG